MGKIKLKVRDSPAQHKRQETEDVAYPLYYLLILSRFSTNRAILSLGGQKPKFKKNEERFKEPPILKGQKKEKQRWENCY